MRPPLEVTSVELPAQGIVGFPMFAAITIQSRPGHRYNSLCFANILGLRGSIGIEATDSSGKLRFRYVDRPIIEQGLGGRPQPLEAAETRRMLTDVSPLLASLPADKYRLRFYFLTPFGDCPDKEATVEIRGPTTSEVKILAASAPDHLRFANWGEWTLKSPHAAIPMVPIAADNPLKLNLLLRQLFYGPVPASRINATILDVLDGLYIPERQALKSELLLARSDNVSYRKVRDELLRTTPGLAWWMRMTDSGGAFIKSFRNDTPAAATRP